MNKKVSRKDGQDVNKARKDEEKNPADEIGEVSRGEYEKLKRRALKFETTNQRNIVIIPCDGNKGWCELGDKSALLYKYEVCNKLGAKVLIDNDMDSYYTQFEIGRVRTRGFDVVRKRIKKAGLYDSEKLIDRCMVFRLNKKYTEDEIKYLCRQEVERQAKINNIAKIDLVDPPLYRELVTVLGRLHKVALRNMDKICQPIVGKKMYEMAFDMVMTYYEIARFKTERVNNHQRWKQIQENASQLIIYLQVMGEQRMIDREVCADIGDKLRGIYSGAGKHV